jgi:hypothetical protein
LQEKRLIYFEGHDNNRFEDDMFVDLTIHDVSASLLKEFAERIIKSYYAGGVSDAIKDLVRKAINEEKAAGK